MEPGRILIHRDAIADRVRRLGESLTASLRDELGPGDDGRIVLVPVMTGAMIFASDLIRAMPLPMRIAPVAASSYAGAATISAGVTLPAGLPADLGGTHVVIVDDILDSGRTLGALLEGVRALRPASLRCVVLLRKRVARAVEIEPDAVGFDIPDAFVVGYGLDHDGAYRNLPDIAVLEPDGAVARAWRCGPIPVIGIAGGIGSGKSAVARAFAEIGFAVSDSDRANREVLGRPEVRDTLVSWWGAGVLGEDGQVDRRAVARLVFGDDPGAAERRARLEALTHPLILREREATYDAAVASGARGMVLDAPLLFEAGLDGTCDRVIFVDAAREVRLARVASRGWDASELDRREAAQLPLDAKRARADAVVVNDASEAALRAAVSRIADGLAGPAPGERGEGRPPAP